MKAARIRFLVAIPILLILYLGCGGSGTSPDAGTPDPDESGNQQLVKIMGAVTGSEGIGAPDVELTFFSDPVVAVTDAEGVFTAVLAVGTHSLEVAIDGAITFTGTVTVVATDLFDEAGNMLGTFTLEMEDAADNAYCGALQFIDSVASSQVSTLYGIVEGGLGNEITSQGINPTVLIVGNGEMTANFTGDGRLNALWFPSVGAYNHIPYLSMAAEWMKPFQGSFGGVRANGSYHWFSDPARWSVDVRYEGTSISKGAPVAQITYSGLGPCAGTTIVEKAFVPWESFESDSERANMLVRDFQVAAGDLCGGASDPATRLAVYSRYNVNVHYPFFREWKFNEQTQACASNRLTWTRSEAPAYAIAMTAIGSGGERLAMTCDNEISSLEEVRRLYPSAECNPTSVKPGLAEWPIPSDGRVAVITAGCDSETTCAAALDSAAGAGSDAMKAATLDHWLYDYLWTSNIPEDSPYLVPLITLRMLADRRTGAIIAAPSHEPTYYFSWPRDGVFQAAAHIMAGHEEIAEKFFSEFLFNRAQRQDGKWVQAYSSLTGEPLEFLGYSFLEEDQMPTVLWGLWLYWKRTGVLPSGIGASDITDLADYVLSRICADGLISPSLDWHENPLKDIGQSLYTNAAAHAGLLAAAEMIDAAAPSKADGYREAAARIKDAVTSQLCSSGDCHARRKYGADAYDIAQLAIACSVSGLTEFSDEDGEMIMAFSMPFNLFPLDDPLVQSFYWRTAATHSDLDSFSADSSLWVPRYLYSALYAARVVHPEFGAQDEAFRTSMLYKPYVYLGGIYYMLTPQQYFKDEHWGDAANDPEGQGGAARPLGWSQAMGLLAGLERSGYHMPLIGAEDPALLDSFLDDFASGLDKWNIVAADNSGPIPADQLPAIYTFYGRPKPSYDNGEIGGCKTGAYTKDAFDYSEGLNISADIYIQSSGEATFGILEGHPETNPYETKGCYYDYGVWIRYAPSSVTYGYRKDNLGWFSANHTGSYPAGAWHNFRIEITPDQRINFYVDNVLKQQSSSGDRLAERYIGNPIGLGGESPSPARVLIDNVKVWK
ncbi:MAG: hypothetical protein JXA24_06265 [Proteobacteria bacterium]|nr:hypothetical protein [Pseudomonadota bacterium]